VAALASVTLVCASVIGSSGAPAMPLLGGIVLLNLTNRGSARPRRRAVRAHAADGQVDRAVLIVALYELHAASARDQRGPLDNLAVRARRGRASLKREPRRGCHPCPVRRRGDLVALCVLAFARRDQRPLFRISTGTSGRAVMRPSADPLRLPVVAMMDQRRGGSSAGRPVSRRSPTSSSLARTIVDSMLAIPSFAVYFDGWSPHIPTSSGAWFARLFILGATVAW
jgi:hypothetical protein